MKIEYCQKCDKGIKPEEKSYIKNGQILCEECYLRTTKQRPGKPEPQIKNGKFQDARNQTAKIDELVQKELVHENASESLKVDMPKRIASGLNQKEKGKRERSVMKSSKEKPWWDKPINVNALAGGIFLVVIVTIWAYYLFDKPAKRGIEKPERVVTNKRTVGEKRVETDSRRQETTRVEKPKELQIGEEGIVVGDTQFPVGKYETVYWKDRVAGEDSWGEVYVVPSGTRVLVIGKSNRDPTVTKVRILNEGPHQGREYWFSNKYILRKR